MHESSTDVPLTVVLAGALRLVLLDRTDEAVGLVEGHLDRYVRQHGAYRGGSTFVRECGAIAGVVGEALACLAAHRVAAAAGVDAHHVLEHMVERLTA